jgi:hypothetical protein
MTHVPGRRTLNGVDLAAVDALTAGDRDDCPAPVHARVAGHA